MIKIQLFWNLREYKIHEYKVRKLTQMRRQRRWCNEYKDNVQCMLFRVYKIRNIRDLGLIAAAKTTTTDRPVTGAKAAGAAMIPLIKNSYYVRHKQSLRRTTRRSSRTSRR